MGAVLSVSKRKKPFRFCTRLFERRLEMKYKDILWTIAKEIEIDDPHFEFVIGLLSYCLSHDGLSDRQARIADKYFNKYLYLFNGGCNETTAQ